MTLIWTVPLHVRGPNVREHWQQRSRRVTGFKIDTSSVWP